MWNEGETGIAAAAGVGAILLATIFKFCSLSWIRANRNQKFIAVGKVTALHIYPVKSLGGLPVQHAKCTELGIQYQDVADRHFLVVTDTYDMITARQEPTMVLIRPSIQADRLELNAPGMETLHLPKRAQLDREHLHMCRVWGDDFMSLDCGDEAGKWLSAYLKRDGLRLVYAHPDLPLRQLVDCKLKTWETHAQPGDRVAMSDYCGYMMATTETLDALNAELSSPVTIHNFRPNIIVTGDVAFQEDTWDEVRIGEATWRALDHCTRCVFTTIDPKAGVKSADGEPLKTLKRIHSVASHNNEAVFGRNCTLDNPGDIKVGDTVYAIIKQT